MGAGNTEAGTISVFDRVVAFGTFGSAFGRQLGNVTGVDSKLSVAARLASQQTMSHARENGFST
jgi:hypothetical protein